MVRCETPPADTMGEPCAAIDPPADHTTLPQLQDQVRPLSGPRWSPLLTPAQINAALMELHQTHQKLDQLGVLPLLLSALRALPPAADRVPHRPRLYRAVVHENTAGRAQVTLQTRPIDSPREVACTFGPPILELRNVYRTSASPADPSLDQRTLIERVLIQEDWRSLSRRFRRLGRSQWRS
jgi:hypothetical protein